MSDPEFQSRPALDTDLATIRSKLLEMGDRVDHTIADAMQALRTNDQVLAQAVVEGDVGINDLRFEIESLCEATIATQQPAAADLREIVADMNIVVDLERMGDHAAGIAKSVELTHGEPVTPLPESLERIATLTQTMLSQGMKAYADQDVEKAVAVAQKDDRIDQHYQELTRELMEQMTIARRSRANALYLLFAGHNLERIADRVTNITERVVFMSSGRMVELNPEPGETRVS